MNYDVGTHNALGDNALDSMPPKLIPPLPTSSIFGRFCMAFNFAAVIVSLGVQVYIFLTKGFEKEIRGSALCQGL